MAETLVRNAATVIISSRKESALKEVADALNEQGPGKCMYFAADLSTKSGCISLADHVQSLGFSSIDILVNNSGATWGAPMHDFPEDDGWDKIMNLNVKAVFYLTAALTTLLARGKDNLHPGRVINISSVAGLDPRAEMTGVAAGEGIGAWSYGTSKAAVLHLTSIQANELAPRNVIVNAILPGLFPSKMTKLGLELFGDELTSSQPTGRIGYPSDIGGTLLFLTSRASAHVTGAHIVVDGGALIAGVGGFDSIGKDIPKL